MSAPEQYGWTDAELNAAMAVHEAETIVEHEWLAVTALASLDDEQLAGLVWVGIHDEHWSRLRWVAAARGICL